MAAQSTAIADIYEPAIWAEYFLEEMTDKNLLVQSGIASTTPEIDEAAQKGGRTVHMPFWDDLDTSSHAEVPTDTDDTATSTGLTTDKDIAIKLFFTKTWDASPIVKYVAGADPVKIVLDRYINWWLSEEQYIMLGILSGIFSDSTIATALSNDDSGEDGDNATDAQLISSGAIEDTRFLLGDAYDKFTAMIVHSTVLKRLRALDLIDTETDSEQNLEINTYQGLRVLTDDNMTKVAGTTSGYKYHTFLFGQGAFARTEIPIVEEDLPIEMYRVPLQGKGAGRTYVITRRYFLLHPRGISNGTSITSGNAGPTYAQLAADNWTQEFLTKNIRIARLITNG